MGGDLAPLVRQTARIDETRRAETSEGKGEEAWCVGVSLRSVAATACLAAE